MPAHLDLDRFAKTLLHEQAQRGLSQDELAGLLGVRQATVSDWINGKKSPSAKNAQRVIDVLGIEPATIYTGGADGNVVADGSPHVVLIPHDGYADAGPGADNGSTTRKHHPYPTEVIQQLTGFAPTNELRSFTIIGDSHMPEISPNTPAIYRRTADFVGDGLYVLQIDGNEVCKVVQYIPGGAIILSSYNPAYRDVHLTPLPDADTPGTFREDETRLTSVVRIIGKVVFYPKSA